MVLDTCMLNICCGCIPHFHLHLETRLQKNYYSSLHQVTTLGLLRYFFIQKRTFCVFPYICVYRSCSSLKLALSQSLSLSLSLSLSFPLSLSLTIEDRSAVFIDCGGGGKGGRRGSQELDCSAMKFN